MYILAEVIGVISEVFIIYIFIQGICPKKERSPIAILLAYVGYGAGLLILSFIGNAAVLRIGFCCLGIVFLVSFFYTANGIQALFMGMAFCAIYMLIDVGVFIAVSLLHIDSDLIMSRGTSRCIYIATTHIILLAAISIVLCFFKSKSNAITFSFILVLSPGYIISILLALSLCRYLQASASDLPLPFLFASIALLYMNIVLVFYAQQAKISAKARQEIEIAEHHYKMQELYYSQLQNEQNETRALFHDISKRMTAMNELVRENSSEQAHELLSETQKLYENIGNVVDVGNSIISAILNEYKDCYILLGNTLDNAIEGALSVPEGKRRIHLQLRQHQKTLFYKIENSCTEGHTTRKRSGNHGYGLQNVRKCVDKYSGEMVTSYENGNYIFTSRITCQSE